MSHRMAVVHSALWAAYGDALGFITELADEQKVQRRASVGRVEHLLAWTRGLPGRVPSQVRFYQGAYSDDTQLRLATGRAIRADGSFDVAAFAKIELPTWTNYAVGAGIGTKEAAFSLSKASCQWYSNFFKTRRGDYRSGGGNGAAMRIQPHVWAASSGTNIDSILRDVYKNAICTHGHPRGIVGAGFHALCLLHYIRYRSPANSDDLKMIIGKLEDSWSIILGDPDLQLFWAPQWAEGSESPADDFRVAALEMWTDLEALQSLPTSASYRDILERLGLFDGATRGSATKTALAAAWLSARYFKRGVQAALIEAANELGSDTDTIATMTGALLGAVTESAPEETVQDQGYIVSEAERLSEISAGTARTSFGYPDLRSYKSPKSAIDVVLASGEKYVVSGLGPAEPRSPFLTSGDPNGDLRWLRLEFGQTILARIRSTPKTLDTVSQTLFEPPRVRAPQKQSLKTDGDRPSLPSIEAELEAVVESGFSPERIGRAFLRLADEGGDFYLERISSFASLVGHSYKARRVRK